MPAAVLGAIRRVRAGHESAALPDPAQPCGSWRGGSHYACPRFTRCCVARRPRDHTRGNRCYRRCYPSFLKFLFRLARADFRMLLSMLLRVALLAVFLGMPPTCRCHPVSHPGQAKVRVRVGSLSKGHTYVRVPRTPRHAAPGWPLGCEPARVSWQAHTPERGNARQACPGGAGGTARHLLLWHAPAPLRGVLVRLLASLAPRLRRGACVSRNRTRITHETASCA